MADGEITFIDHADRVKRLAGTQAAAVVRPENIHCDLPAAILVTDVHAAFATIMAYSYGEPWLGYFSNPHSTVCGAQCGVALGQGFGEDFFSTSLSPDGLIGGLQGGYNWQVNSMVFGIEGDVSFADWGDSTVVFDSDFDALDDMGLLGVDGEAFGTASSNLDLLASLRGRVGVAFDSLMVYGTGGVAWADAEARMRVDLVDGTSVGEVLDCFDQDVDGYVAQRHAQLAEQGLPGREIYARIQDELDSLRFRAPALSERQIRRRVYG